MSFDESKIRRGQPANAGQFASKNTSAPAATLERPGTPITLPNTIENEGVELDASGYEHAYEVVVKYDQWDTKTANTVVHTHDNLMWRGDFTEDELDDNYELVKDIYRERLGAEIHVEDSWEHIDVSLYRELPVEGLTEEAAHDAAEESYAKWVNETDPGTFGSPYIGDEIRRRIDEAKAKRN